MVVVQWVLLYIVLLVGMPSSHEIMKVVICELLAAFPDFSTDLRRICVCLCAFEKEINVLLIKLPPTSVVTYLSV